MSIKKSSEFNHETIGTEKTEGKGFEPKLEVVELEDTDLEDVNAAGYIDRSGE